MKKKQIIIAAAAVLILLAAAFWYGGDAPGLQGWSLSQDATQSSAGSSQDSSTDSSGPSSSAEPEGDNSASDGASAEGSTSGENTQPAPQEPGSSAQGQNTSDQSTPTPDTSSKPEETTPPTDPQPETPSSSQNTQPEEQATTCSISIVCTTVLDHLDWLTPGKEDILPAGGIMLSATQVEPQEGETVFSLLQRITRENGIPMEASFTPGTGSAYVEGIGNLYEFDCGQRSGWLYFVNGISPGYSCSEYTLKPGDRVEWVYTCDLGQDVGATVAGG